jgi:hypothetical protein
MVYSDLRLGSLSLELTPSTFRKTAIGLTAAAVLGFSAVGFSHSAMAAEGTGSPACASIKDATAGAKCEISESIRRTNANIQRGAEAERIGSAAAKRTECTENLTSWARGNNTRIEAVRVILNGRSIKEVDTCDVWQRVQRTSSLESKFQPK